MTTPITTSLQLRRKPRNGQDAIDVYVENDNVVFNKRGDIVNIYVAVWQGDKQIPYDREGKGEGYACSSLPNPLFDGDVRWTANYDIETGRFYYRMICLATDPTTLNGKSISFDVTYGDRTIHHTIHFRTMPKGDAGYEGCVVRRSEWQEGVYYHNDQALTPEQCLSQFGTTVRYIDEVSVTDLVSGASAWYLCHADHNGKASSPSNKPGTATTYWTQLNDMRPLRTSFADIMQAFIQYLQVRQVVITDKDESGNDVPYGAFGGGSGNYPLWFGGQTPEDAMMRVNRQGHLYLGTNFSVIDGIMNAVDGVFSGWVKGSPLLITANNILNYVHLGTYYDPGTHQQLYGWILDIYKTGPNIVFYSDSLNQQEESLGGCPSIYEALDYEAIDRGYKQMAGWDGRLQIHLPWFSPYAISNGVVYPYVGLGSTSSQWISMHGLNLRDEMNAAYGLLNSHFHIFNVSDMDIHVEHGVQINPLLFPTDESYILYGSTNGKGQEFLARCEYNRYQDTYEGTQQNGYGCWWTPLYAEASNLLSRIHATYITQRTK